ncbi:TAT-variant-translocated molybdopterin oxidoreductase [bacterium]|nr:TAT-variant-translocated molybdopterin oxidoreductase [bacterium]
MKDENENLLSKVRDRLSSVRGREYWRSLDELAQTEEFKRLVQNEFPQNAALWDASVDRRSFLKFMGASLALAGLGACTRQPTEKIIPYVKQPEQIIPGKPLFFATAFTLGGFATGVLAESHMGRPIKIEGNPDHPASLGATDCFAQASVLELYDPDRSQVVSRAGRISTWETFLAELNAQLESQKATDGAGIRILTETVTSPTLASQLQGFLSRYPSAKWHQYEPINRDNYKRGTQLAFGELLDGQYRFDQADIILGLDADFLFNQVASLRHARDFATKRKVNQDHGEMNRLYTVESSPSLTGAMADHRLNLQAREIGQLAAVLAQELGIPERFRFKVELGSVPSSILAEESTRDWIKALARDLQKHQSNSIVLAGKNQPPEVHALTHAMNAALDNIGRTVRFTNPAEAESVIQTESLSQLVTDMEDGKVEMLVMIGGNPVFNAPADLNFVDALERVKFRVHHSLWDDETSQHCHWHIPQTHYLEHWSDACAYDGTASIIQPLIAPLYGGKSIHEFVAALSGQAGPPGHEIVKNYWQSQQPADGFEVFWQTAVHDGLIAGTTFPEKTPILRMTGQQFDFQSGATDGLEINFKPDPTIWDGRFINNGWLQELPKPLTKLTWDNAALISPATAARLDLQNEQLVDLNYDGRTVKAPVWITPGQPENSVAVHFGYGRRRTGRVGTGSGFNAFALRTSGQPWFDSGLELTPTGETYALASTQLHSNMENRHLVRVGTLEEYRAHPEFVHKLAHDPPDDLTFYPKFENKGYAWGMAVDLNSCIGCGACTVACQSENNIPVVGKDQVQRGREMHWIRVDRYYEGHLENPATYHQPVMCMHCENAPCEVVCPVGATTHSDEGLNEMTYNRCVGTRYCANNCPYKVRRFNFYLYADYETESLKLLQNPDVTVRSRGVMEKCTYCVQRINAARIEAKKEDREIADGDIQTACQQVCPTDAIVFGDINDPDSAISKLRSEHRNYGILTETGTRPRTTYLAKLRNPNPEIEQS